MIVPFLAVVKKELKSVLRDGTIFISILIQLFIASFSSGLLLGVLSLYDADTILSVSGTEINIGIVGELDHPLAVLMSERGLGVVPFSSLSAAQTAFYEGDVWAFVDAPSDATDLTEIKLYLPDSETVSSLVRMVIQEPLKQYENYLRSEKGIEVRYADLKGKPAISFEFVYSALIPMLMFFPAFVAGSISIDMITEEVENKTLPTLLSAPLTISGMVSAKMTAAVTLAIVQCAAWLTLLHLNGIEIHNAAWILILALVIAGISSTSAALTASLLKDRERSQFIYSLFLLAAVSVSTLLDFSPITTLSRLAVGDAYTSGWHVMLFAAFFLGLYFLLIRASRRLMM